MTLEEKQKLVSNIKDAVNNLTSADNKLQSLTRLSSVDLIALFQAFVASVKIELNSGDSTEKRQ